jgi:hypothetical protein
VKELKKIEVNLKSYEKAKQIAKEQGLTLIEVFDLLIDFYELKHLELLLTALRAKAQTGLRAEELAQLSVLLTFLQARLPQYS